ncbi:hypothetical protein HMPREF1534_02944, partial [Phocaeicola massiliensis B84634 = Timone 84634 = DSM 17679 = JCM 13223]
MFWAEWICHKWNAWFARSASRTMTIRR